MRIAKTTAIAVAATALFLPIGMATAGAQAPSTVALVPAAQTAATGVTAGKPRVLIFGVPFGVQGTDANGTAYTGDLRPQLVETLPASAGRSKFRVTFRYRAATGSVPFDQANLVMVASGGERFSAAPAAAGSLGSGVVPASGEKVGTVEFDVPDDDRSLLLGYAPGQDVLASWTLAAH